MATKNYISNNSVSSEYYKVSFVTTHSESIPKKMKQTGALIIMDNIDSYRKSIWFRGELIASGYGFIDQDESVLATYFINNVNKIFGNDEDQNGIYDFIPGYIGPNGSQGESIHTRFTNLTNSYNELRAYTYTNVGYLYEFTEDSWEYFNTAYSYFESAYSYTLDYIETTYKELAAYVESTYNDLHNYIDINCAEINEHIDTVEEELSERIQNNYDELSESIKTTYNDACSYTGYMSDLLHKYVNSTLTKLIGGAPETLDTLGEIASLLQSANTYGLYLWDSLYEIQNNYIRHDEKIVNNCYTYITEHSYSLQPIPHVADRWYENYPDTDLDEFFNSNSMEEWLDHEETSNGWEGYYNHEGYITYYFIENSNYIALKGDQVCTGEDFNNKNLVYLLKKIIPPYKYDIPDIYLTRYQEDELNNIILEYGEKITLEAKAMYNPKDASTVEFLYLDDTNNYVNTPCIIEDNNLIYYNNSKSYHYDNDREITLNLGDIIPTNPNYHTLRSIWINYGESYDRVYPELRDVNPNFIDEEHKIKTGQYYKNIFMNIRIPVRFRMFYWYDDKDNTTDLENISLTDKQSILITSLENKTPLITTAIEMSALYIAIPDYILNNTIGLKIQNHDTGICKEILFNKIDSNLFKLKRTNYELIKENGIINYGIYKYSGTNWLSGECFRILLELSQLEI